MPARVESPGSTQLPKAPLRGSGSKGENACRLPEPVSLAMIILQTREEGGAKCKQSTFSLAKTRHKRHHGEKETEFLDVLVMTVFMVFSLQIQK